MSRRTVKLVLLSVLVVGALGSVTVHGVYGLLSGQASNRGGSIATGTLTMENVNAASAASTTLGSAVGSTTLSAAVPETTLSAAMTNGQTTLTVASAAGYPASAPYTILVGSEQMTVTAGAGTTTWTVTRAVNSTTAAAHSTGATVDPTTIAVAAATNFPSSGNYAIRVDNEVMTVTGGQGTTSWTVTRAANGSSIATHASGASVLQETVNVASAAPFPSSGDYTVLVDSEKMLVTGGQGTTTWTVSRAVDGTAAAGHASGAAVATAACKSLNGTLNVNTGCDSVLAWSPDTESYPGTPVTTDVAVTDTGSLGASDLEVYMPACLRAVTPDAPAASTAPGISSFTGASTSGGSLVGGTTYYYEVTSVSSTGSVESVAGSESSYTPPSGTSTNQIALNWAAVGGAASYKIYRSTTEGGEQLLATVGPVTSYTDNTGASPSGSPPSGTGSGNPCLTGTAQLYIQETTSAGANKHCWYPSTATSCAFDAALDLGAFAHNAGAPGTSVDLGAGPAALGTRYFKIGVQFPSGASNALQGTEAAFTLRWYGLS